MIPKPGAPPWLDRHVRVGAGLLGLILAAALLAGASTPSADADTTTPHRVTKKNPTAYGFGGAVSTVDPEATAAGLRVLRRGGNAVDAAVATAAALGVTEPYSAGIGGGGYFVYYDAKTRKVHTIDGRETAPQSMPDRPRSSTPRPGSPTRLRSWSPPACRSACPARWPPGTRAAAVGFAVTRRQPAAGHRIADRGFVVDETFRRQTLDNKARFAQIMPTAELFLPDGDAPQVGSVFNNPDLADTYRGSPGRGASVFYRGPLAAEIAGPLQHPPKTPNAELPVFPGHLTTSDLAEYKVIDQDPTKVRYRPGRVRDGAVVIGRHHGRRGAEHPRHRRSGAVVDPAGAALLPGGLGAGVRRPGCVRRRPGVRRRADAGTAVAAVRRQRACQIAPAARRLVTPTAHGRSLGPRLRRGGPVGRPPTGMSTTHLVAVGQLGQRGLVHADDRADRRFRHHRPGPRLPAEQRADRLLAPSTTPPTRTGSRRASGRGRRCRRRSCWTAAASRCSARARRVARRSSPRCCRPW